MAGTNEAWNEVGDRFATWGRRVAERYKEAGGAASEAAREGQRTLEDAARDVTDALDRAFTALGDTIRDDDAKQDLKEAVRALGDAISVTVSETTRSGGAWARRAPVPGTRPRAGQRAPPTRPDARTRLPGEGLRCGSARARPDLVQPPHRALVELQIQCAHRPFELFDDPGNWARSPPGSRAATRARPRQVARRAPRRTSRTPRPAAGGRRACPAPCSMPASSLGHFAVEHAGEQPAPQRAPRDHAHPVVLARREHLELDRPLGEVVDALLGHEPEEMTSLRGLVRLRDIPAGEVAPTDVDDLALLHERLERLPDLVPRRLSVDVVHLVHVDDGRSAARRRLSSGVADVQRREPGLVRPRPHLAVDLGGEHHLVAPPAPLANHLPTIVSVVPTPLRCPYTFAVSKKLIPCSSARSMIAWLSGSLVSRSEVHRPQTQRAHLQPQTTEMAVLHSVRV